MDSPTFITHTYNEGTVIGHVGQPHVQQGKQTVNELQFLHSAPFLTCLHAHYNTNENGILFVPAAHTAMPMVP